MRLFALEALDQSGQLRSHGAHLAAVLARFGSKGFEAALAVAFGPFQQRIDRERTAAGIGMDWSIWRARATRSEEAAGAARGASARTSVGACFRNRRIQNWQR